MLGEGENMQSLSHHSEILLISRLIAIIVSFYKPIWLHIGWEQDKQGTLGNKENQDCVCIRLWVCLGPAIDW
jgi:hypothetical protein